MRQIVGNRTREIILTAIRFFTIAHRPGGGEKARKQSMGAKCSGKNLAINKDRVGRFAIFTQLTSPQLAELFVLIRRRDYSPGEVLIKEGRQAMGLFILIGGTVSVVKSSKFGKGKLTEVSAPSILGEVGLLSGIPRTARVRAQTRVIAGYIPALLFKNKLA